MLSVTTITLAATLSAASLANPLPSLTHISDGTPMMVSSHDRTWDNDDGFNGVYSFLRRTIEGDYVIFEDHGPGVIQRMWFTDIDPAERLQFWFGDEDTPRLDLPIRDFFNGNTPPFQFPLTADDTQSSGGFVNYVPIPYADGLRITTPGKPRFYCINYLQLPPDQAPEDFSAAHLISEDAINAASEAYPKSSSPPLHLSTMESAVWALPQSGALSLNLHGNGTIRQIRISALSDHDRHQLAEVRLRIYWDGNTNAAVDVPLLAFFGSHSPEETAYVALPLGFSMQGSYCNFPMPFTDVARLEVTSEKPIPDDITLTIYATKDDADITPARFHARYHEQTAEWGVPIEILRTTGRGQYVGTVMHMDGDERGLWFLEGDEQIFVDGARYPQIHGTGTEDYFNGGWYFSHGPFDLPFHGVTLKQDKPDAKATCYRFHILDPVPFKESINVQIEHGVGCDYVGGNYKLVSYWYERPGTATGEPVQAIYPATEHVALMRPPKGSPRPIEFVEGLQVEDGHMELVLPEVYDPLIRGPHLAVLHPDKPGADISTTLTVDHPDRYTLRVSYLAGPAFGRCGLDVDGVRMGEIRAHKHQGFHAINESDWGVLPLEPGPHNIRLIALDDPEAKPAAFAFMHLALEPLPKDNTEEK